MDPVRDYFALNMSAAIVDDLESIRIANTNRLSQLTRDEPDADGVMRGFAVGPEDATVILLTSLVADLAATEHQAILNLRRVMRAHPLGPWMAVQRGIGEKQGARLLAAIGDPYMRPAIAREGEPTEPARPRTVSELWAYSGLHVVDFPGGHRTDDTQSPSAAGEPSRRHSDPRRLDTQTDPVGVAVHRQRGVHANWSPAARMRAYLVAASCVKQPSGTTWRDVYEAGRVKYADAVHRAPCKRCRPKTKPPAPVGSPLSDGHQHARAVRLIAKGILRELWREAGRLHGDDTSRPPVVADVA